MTEIEYLNRRVGILEEALSSLIQFNSGYNNQNLYFFTKLDDDTRAKFNSLEFDRKQDND